MGQREFNPNAAAMEQLIDHLNLPEQRLLLIAVGEGDTKGPLPTFAVMALGIANVIVSEGMPVQDIQLALGRVKRYLQHAGAAFEAEIDEWRRRTPLTPEGQRQHQPRALAILDHRYVLPPTYDLRGFYDTAKDEWIATLPAQALVTWAIDLNVLMLRLLDKMERLQEHKDAVRQHAADPQPRGESDFNTGTSAPDRRGP